MHFSLTTCMWHLLAALGVVVGSEGIEIEGKHVKLFVSPEGGAAVDEFRHIAAGDDLAGPDGLLQEGFGVGNFYVPNRRLNERLE